MSINTIIFAQFQHIGEQFRVKSSVCVALLALAAGSCSTSPTETTPAPVVEPASPDQSAAAEPPAPAQETPETPPAPKPMALAEPITPILAETYPHLRRYTGNILLANHLLQVVLAGVPPEPGLDAWQPALATAFHWQAGRWLPLTDGLDLKVIGPTGTPYAAIGLDTEVKEDRATVLFVLGGPERHGTPVKVTYSLATNEDVVTMRLVDFVDPAAAGHAKTRWAVRHRRLSGEVSVASTPDRPELTRLVSHDPGRAGLGVIGYSPLRMLRQGLETELEPAATANEPRPGLDIFLGPRAAALLPARLAAIETCTAAPHGGDAEAFFAELDRCLTESGEARLAIKAQAEDGELKPFARRLALLDDQGRPVTTLTVPSGGEGELRLGAGHGYRLLELGAAEPTERAFVRRAAGQEASVTLPSRRLGRLRIELKPDEAAKHPLLLALGGIEAARTVSREGDEKPTEALPSLGTGRFLIPSLPIELSLPVGRYEALLARGLAGAFCSKAIDVKADAVARLTCTLKASPRTDELRPLDLAEADRTDLSPEARKALTGASELAVALASENDAASHKTPTSLRVLTMAGTTRSVSLRLIDASPDAKARWQGYQGEARGTLLQRFSAFAWEGNRKPLLELSCPGPDLGIDEYRRLIIRLRPTALQIFGCGSQQTEDALLALAGSLQAGRDEPFYLTAASGLGSAPARPFLPVIIRPLRQGTDSVLGNASEAQAGADASRSEALAPVTAALRSASYSLSRGAILQIAARKDSQSQEKPRRAAGGLAVAVRPLTGVKVSEVRLYSERGLIHTSPIAPESAGATQIVSLPLPRPQTAAWLRIEVRGELPKGASWQDEGTVVVASSSFLPLK